MAPIGVSKPKKGDRITVFLFSTDEFILFDDAVDLISYFSFNELIPSIPQISQIPNRFLTIFIENPFAGVKIGPTIINQTKVFFRS
jgi:hypothetical protein